MVWGYEFKSWVDSNLTRVIDSIQGCVCVCVCIQVRFVDWVCFMGLDSTLVKAGLTIGFWCDFGNQGI